MNSEKNIVFQRKRDLSGLLNSVFNFLGQEFPQLALKVWLPVLILGGILIGLNQIYYLSLGIGDTDTLINSHDIADKLRYFQIFQLLIHMIFYYLIFSSGIAFISTYIRKESNQEKFLGELFVALIKIIPLFITGLIIAWLCSFLIPVVKQIIPFYGMFYFHAVIFSFVFELIVMILLLPVFLAVFVKIFEQENTFNALYRSLKMLRGNLLNTVLGLITFWAIQYFMEAFLDFLFFTIIADLLRNILNFVLPVHLVYSLSNILSVFCFSIVILYLAFQYFNLVERKESQYFTNTVGKQDIGDNTTDDDIDTDKNTH